MLELIRAKVGDAAGYSGAQGGEEDGCCDGGKSGNAACCCGKGGLDPAPRIMMNYAESEPWVIGEEATPAGKVLKTTANLTLADNLGSWKARWGINRMNYTIPPGIYCLGDPDKDSEVLVTANYKMSFDRLRRELAGLSVWILVLDTKGINVWCAAGKGTFGTDELVNRIKKVELASIVAHRTIILPQLGAPGIKAHEVFKRSGFKVVYGPVRAGDIKAFLENDRQAEPEMRVVHFSVKDRLVLTPIELLGTVKPVLILFGVLFIINSLGIGHFGFVDLYAFLGAVLVGTVLTPVLLPYVPGRAFAFKGWLLGIFWATAVNILNGGLLNPSYGWWNAAAYLLLLPVISAYPALNFTGCSTYTSPSGVKREMQIALPLLLVSAAAGVIFLAVGGILKMTMV